MDGRPVEDETGWDGVAAGMPVEWCKPKWNGLGWIAWSSCKGVIGGRSQAVIYRGMQLRGLWIAAQASAFLLLLGQICMQQQARQASSKSTGRRETENRVAFRPDLES